MPGDRFSLAVEVGREPDLPARGDGVLGSGLEVLHDLLFALENFVAGLEALLDLDARHRILDTLGILAGQIAHMPDRGEHDIVVAEVLVDRLGLGRRFDNHQRLALGVTFFIVRPERLAARGLLGRLLGRLFRGLLFGGLLGHISCVAS